MFTLNIGSGAPSKPSKWVFALSASTVPLSAALCRSTAGPVNHKCVQRLMQKMGLRALIRAKKSFRQVPGMSDANVPNVLQRDFFAEAPNQKWVTDVTEFNVHGQKLYLSACIRYYNHERIKLGCKDSARWNTG